MQKLKKKFCNGAKREAYTEGDNELLIDFENVLSVKMLYSTIKKRPEFSLTEFLFNIENGVVADAQGNPFTNEFIITFKKNTK